MTKAKTSKNFTSQPSDYAVERIKNGILKYQLLKGDSEQKRLKIFKIVKHKSKMSRV